MRNPKTGQRLKADLDSLTVSHGGEMSALALQEPTPDNATCAIECCVHIYVVHVL